MIGINAITVQFASGISFAIPVDAAREFLSRALEKEKTGNYSKKGQKTLGPYQQWYIGISMLTLTPPILEELQRRNPNYSEITKGVLVARVNYGSPAHRYCKSLVEYSLTITLNLLYENSNRLYNNDLSQLSKKKLGY